MIKAAIRHYREQANLTQQQLADAVLCSVDTVRRWEAGVRDPRAGDIAKLAAALGVSEAELLNGPEENKIRIEVFFDKIDETEEFIEMGNKSVFSLFLSPDGAIGIRGGAKFANLEDIEKFISDAGAQLKEAFKWQQERGAIPATA